jgi:hypothetical protein
MLTTAIAISILVGSLTSLFLGFVPLILILTGERGRAAQEKARARRMAEHKMNARLLRFNL